MSLNVVSIRETVALSRGFARLCTRQVAWASDPGLLASAALYARAAALGCGQSMNALGLLAEEGVRMDWLRTLKTDVQGARAAQPAALTENFAISQRD